MYKRQILAVLTLLAVLLSVTASFYIYDLSPLYALKWMAFVHPAERGAAVNIHAGFDEFGASLQQRYSGLNWLSYDFFDARHHTEWSVQRARKIYPPSKDTVKVHTASLPADNESQMLVTLFFAAHEIRQKEEREAFFAEVNRILHRDGKVVVVEHLRDWRNFLVYTLGFFHFLPRSAWQQAWRHADWKMTAEKTITPFVHCFILEKNANTP